MFQLPFDFDSNQELSQICARFGVKRLELFGSAAREELTAASDLDFLVEFTEDHSLGMFDRYFGLKEALEELFHRPVDLIEMKAIRNPYFRQAVEKEKELIYAS